MKDGIADLRNKWKLFYNQIKEDERKNIVIYFDKYKPYALPVIQIEVLNKTKMARKMLKHLAEINLI